MSLCFIDSFLMLTLKRKGVGLSGASFSIYEGEAGITKQLEEDNGNYGYSQIFILADGSLGVINEKKPS